MEDALELSNYLPRSFKTPNEQEYINFLWSAFETNYEARQYQFAYFSFHMLVMSFVYFLIWQIRKNTPDDFYKATIGYRKDDGKILYESESPFAFSKISESSIFRVLKLINCDDSKIGKYTRLARYRNDTAHANGNIYLKNQDALDFKIREILRSVDEIQVCSSTVVQEGYRIFLIQSCDKEEREYFDSADQIREILLRANYMSQKDVASCTTFDVATLREEPGFTEIAALHHSLCESYGWG